MNALIYKTTALGMSLMLALLPGPQLIAQTQSETPAANAPPNLRDTLQKGYPELFDLAPTLQFNPQQIQEQRQALQRGEDACRRTFRGHAETYKKQMESARRDLKAGGEKLPDARRHDLHCTIQGLELLKSEADVLANHAIPTAYDNLAAKLDLVQQWPEQHRQTLAAIADQSYSKRPYGDVKDIGFREIAPGQQDDIRRGQQALEEMRRTGLMPPALENKEIQQYVDSVAQRIAQH